MFFFIWPYLEVGRSRRYADRRAGLSLSMAFITFMLMSNWMGSPEFLVQATSELEVSQRIMPQEGHSVLLEVPYEEWQVGTYWLMKPQLPRWYGLGTRILLMH